MPGFKLTTWNVEWADRTLDDLDGKGGAASTKMRRKTEAEQKLAAIRAEIAALDPDILFVCEGPKGEARAGRYFALVAPDHVLVTHGDPTGRAYATDGQQWLWFLVRRILIAQLAPSLLPVATWQAFTRDQSDARHEAGQWKTAAPQFERDAKNPADLGRLGPHELVDHTHYRHPQVLRLTCNEVPVEIIGLHLKSKLVLQNEKWMKWRKPAGSARQPPTYAAIAAAIQASPGYIAASVAARAKLATEAADVRYYIERRFAQEPDPAIFLVGDINDGPGKELIEEWFMLHDLLGNLQGDVFAARSFLNHALFDFEDSLRWSVRFPDPIDPRRDPNLLIDHIMFTQRLTGAGRGGLRVLPRAGRVEHEVHERIASLLARGVSTSDHRPVSVFVTAVDGQGNKLP